MYVSVQTFVNYKVRSFEECLSRVIKVTNTLAVIFFPNRKGTRYRQLFPHLLMNLYIVFFPPSMY